MKANHSKEFYLDNWTRFIEKTNERDYMNLEADLERTMATFDGAGLNDKAIEIIRNVKAQEIIKKVEVLVRERMQTIKDLESGKSSLGYTTQIQENAARAKMRDRWEFNCLQLAMFKEAHK